MPAAYRVHGIDDGTIKLPQCLRCGAGGGPMRLTTGAQELLGQALQTRIKPYHHGIALALDRRDTVAEMGEQRATGFLKKFYGWYLGRGRFPKPFANELVRLETIEQVEDRLLAAAPGASDVLARLEADLPAADNVVLDLPVSIYAGG